MSRKELKRSYNMYTDVFNVMLPNCSYDKNNEDITFHGFKIVWWNENNTMFETEWILFYVLFVLLIGF